MVAQAGNTGPDIRSDCFVQLETTTRGGLRTEIDSKVHTLYGKDILSLLEAGMRFFGLKNARLWLEDQGALPFVIMARLEAAVKQCVETEKEFLPEMLPANRYASSRERFRFSRLYLPGNTPKMMLNAGIHRPDGIILDLEDSVAPGKKEEARLLVRNALRAVDFYGAERMVRINQWPAGKEDLACVVPYNLHMILLPKCESAIQVRELDEAVEKLTRQKGGGKDIFLMPIIESASGVEMAYEIATASPRVVAMAIGLEDYTADIGVMRTAAGDESLYARTRLVNACKAARIQPIDSVFSDVADTAGLKESIRISRSLGFEGMGCIHPLQIGMIREGFTPQNEEIEKAKKIVLAFDKASAKGLGVVALGTKMIDPPVVKRALRVIELATGMGVLSKKWRTEGNEK